MIHLADRILPPSLALEERGIPLGSARRRLLVANLQRFPRTDKTAC